MNAKLFLIIFLVAIILYFIYKLSCNRQIYNRQLEPKWETDELILEIPEITFDNEIYNRQYTNCLTNTDTSINCLTGNAQKISVVKLSYANSYNISKIKVINTNGSLIKYLKLAVFNSDNEPLYVSTNIFKGDETDATFIIRKCGVKYIVITDNINQLSISKIEVSISNTQTQCPLSYSNLKTPPSVNLNGTFLPTNPAKTLNGEILQNSYTGDIILTYVNNYKFILQNYFTIPLELNILKSQVFFGQVGNYKCYFSYCNLIPSLDILYESNNKLYYHTCSIKYGDLTFDLLPQPPISAGNVMLSDYIKDTSISFAWIGSSSNVYEVIILDSNNKLVGNPVRVYKDTSQTISTLSNGQVVKLSPISVVLKPSTSYFLKMKSVNDKGNYSITSLDYSFFTIPSAPIVTKVSNVTSNGFDVYWDGNITDSPYTSMYMTIKDDSNPSVNYLYTQITKSPYSVNGLPDTSYSVYLDKTDVNGKRNTSQSPVSIRTFSHPVITSKVSTSTGLTVTWTPKYDSSYSALINGNTFPLGNKLKGVSYTDFIPVTNLNASTIYDLVITYQGIIGYDVNLNPKTVTGNISYTDRFTTFPTKTIITNTSVIDNGFAITLPFDTTYIYTVYLTNVSDLTKTTVQINQSTQNITGLIPGTDYTIVIRKRDINGNYSDSDPITRTTKPGNVTGLSNISDLSDITNVIENISWSSVINSTSYNISILDTTNNTTVLTNYNTTNTFYKNTIPFYNGHTYKLTINSVRSNSKVDSGIISLNGNIVDYTFTIFRSSSKPPIVTLEEDYVYISAPVYPDNADGSSLVKHQLYYYQQGITTSAIILDMKNINNTLNRYVSISNITKDKAYNFKIRSSYNGSIVDSTETSYTNSYIDLVPRIYGFMNRPNKAFLLMSADVNSLVSYNSFAKTFSFSLENYDITTDTYISSPVFKTYTFTGNSYSAYTENTTSSPTTFTDLIAVSNTNAANNYYVIDSTFTIPSNIFRIKLSVSDGVTIYKPRYYYINGYVLNNVSTSKIKLDSMYRNNIKFTNAAGTYNFVFFNNDKSKGFETSGTIIPFIRQDQTYASVPNLIASTSTTLSNQIPNYNPTIPTQFLIENILYRYGGTPNLSSTYVADLSYPEDYGSGRSFDGVHGGINKPVYALDTISRTFKGVTSILAFDDENFSHTLSGSLGVPQYYQVNLSVETNVDYIKFYNRTNIDWRLVEGYVYVELLYKNSCIRTYVKSRTQTNSTVVVNNGVYFIDIKSTNNGNRLLIDAIRITNASYNFMHLQEIEVWGIKGDNSSGLTTFSKTNPNTINNVTWIYYSVASTNANVRYHTLCNNPVVVNGTYNSNDWQKLTTKVIWPTTTNPISSSLSWITELSPNIQIGHSRTYQKLYNAATTLNVTFYFQGDDAVILYVNGVSIGNNNDYTTTTVINRTLNSGLNTIHAVVLNLVTDTNRVGGFILACKDNSNNVLFVTDGDWTMS